MPEGVACLCIRAPCVDLMFCSCIPLGLNALNATSVLFGSNLSIFF